MEEKDIRGALSALVHPENGKPVEVRGVSVEEGRVRITIGLARSRDPFAGSIKKQAEAILAAQFPGAQVTVLLQEPSVKPRAERPAPEAVHAQRIIAIASGKGGVGKSTVTASLALALSGMGYRVGVLDADIYGPSQGKLFGVENYRPEVENIDGKDMMSPALAHGVKVMSIGFFINASDALVWRGPMATSALRQMIHQTLWGELDYLLIDMPPGTGDVHLTILSELKVCAAVIVTTPQELAVADVVRGIAMFKAESIAVPVLGIVENMAWFTPAELPGSRYYIFGKGGGAALAREQGLPLLAAIPMVLPAEGQSSQVVENGELAETYRSLAQRIITADKC